MLKAALNRAFQAGRVPSDQAWRRVKPFAKVDEAVVRYLTADEARRLVKACDADFRRLVQAALLTGCRYSELTRLRASAFNPDSGTLAIRLSKGKVRHVTLTDEGALCFAEWTRRRAPTSIFFCATTAPSGDLRISSVRSSRRARRPGSPHRSRFTS